MVYRSDVEALEARYRALQAELSERTRARDEVAQMLEEARGRARYEAVLMDLAWGGPARRRRRAWSAGVIAVLALFGIALGYRLAKHERAERTDQWLDRFSAFAEETCRCRDAACAQQVSNEIAAWSTEMAREDPSPPKLDRDSMERATEIGKRMADCMTKAMTIEWNPGPAR